MRYESPNRAKPLDDPIGMSGDNGFMGLDSHTNPTLLKAGYLQTSENCRLDESTGIARGRKGIKRVSSDATLLAEVEIFATARYQHPNDTDYVCLSADEKAYFVDASNTSGVTTTGIAYQTRGGSVETAGSDSFLVQAYDKMYLFRGVGLRLPFDLDGTLGKYPLVFEGDMSSGKFDRPESRAITDATNTTPIIIQAVTHGFHG